MGEVYKTLVLNNLRDYKKISPENLKQEVKTLLKADVVTGNITRERYTQIVGEEYVE